MTGGIASPVLWVISAVVCLLAVASAALRILRARHPECDYTELKLRLKTWWILVAIFGTAMLLNRAVSILFFAFMSFLALKEYFSLIPTRRADRRVLFWAYLAVPLQYLWVAQEWYGMFIIFIPVYLFLLLPLRMVLVGETSGFIAAAGTLHWGLMTTVFSLSHLGYLLVLPPLNGSPGGPGAVLYLVVLTQLNDVAQYIWGKTCGRCKVIPKVSPNKTVEGLLGGVGTTTVLAMLLAPLLTPLALLESAAAGLLIAFAGFIGDVTISAVKRDLRIKDSGTLLTGHGGILDRVDSLTYTAPLFFHFLYYLHY